MEYGNGAVSRLVGLGWLVGCVGWVGWLGASVVGE